VYKVHQRFVVITTRVLTQVGQAGRQAGRQCTVVSRNCNRNSLRQLQLYLSLIIYFTLHNRSVSIEKSQCLRQFYASFITTFVFYATLCILLHHIGYT
jgi:hypothetical protein